MRPRARRERWILRERRYCRKYGFCAFCLHPDVKRLATHALYIGFLVDQLQTAIEEEILPREEALMRRIFPEMAADPVQSASSSPDRPGTGH
ncbi:MAG: hypothetical protein HOV84_17535 [Streptomyces sp.]|nr:hypothetical protein [Streptomyces sp.]